MFLWILWVLQIIFPKGFSKAFSKNAVNSFLMKVSALSNTNLKLSDSLIISCNTLYIWNVLLVWLRNLNSFTFYFPQNMRCAKKLLCYSFIIIIKKDGEICILTYFRMLYFETTDHFRFLGVSNWGNPLSFVLLGMNSW